MKHCPRCQHTHFVKNGYVNAKQRHKCKNCQYQWTRTTSRGKPQAHKTLTVLLYCHGILMNAISKLFGIHVTTVLEWIRTSAKKHAPKPTLSPGTTVVLELDEMWHYIRNIRKTNFGYGRHLTETRDTSSIGNVADATQKPSKN